jgi:hypothetical protein
MRSVRYLLIRRVRSYLCSHTVLWSSVRRFDTRSPPTVNRGSVSVRKQPLSSSSASPHKARKRRTPPNITKGEADLTNLAKLAIVDLIHTIKKKKKQSGRNEKPLTIRLRDAPYTVFPVTPPNSVRILPKTIQNALRMTSRSGRTLARAVCATEHGSHGRRAAPYETSRRSQRCVTVAENN